MHVITKNSKCLFCVLSQYDNRYVYYSTRWKEPCFVTLPYVICWATSFFWNQMRTNATRCHIWTYSIHVRNDMAHAHDTVKYVLRCLMDHLSHFPLSTHIWIDAIYHKDFYEWGTDDIGVVLLHGQVFSCFSYFFWQTTTKMDISCPV